MTDILRRYSLSILVTVLAGMVLEAPGTPAWGAPQPSPAPQSSPVDPPEPAKPPVWDVVGRAGHAMNSWLQELVASALEPVLRLLSRTIFSTPHLQQHPRIRELWRFSLAIADGALILFVLAGSVMVTLGGLSSQITLKEMAPRLVLAAAAANLTLPLAGQAISITNAVSLALLGTATDAESLASRLSELIFAVGLSSPLFLIFALIVVVLGVLVVVAYVVRLAVLVILLAGGPLALLTHALPQTDHFARAWWRLLLAMVVSPVLQALVLATGMRVFLSGEGISGIGSGSLIDLLVIGCLLYLLYRIPLWTIKAALLSTGSRAWAALRYQVAASGVRRAISA